MSNDLIVFGTTRFHLSIPDIDTIGSFWQCSGLELSFDVYEYHEGGNNDFVHRLPGALRFPNLMLSRGLTNKDALLKWFYATTARPRPPMNCHRARDRSSRSARKRIALSQDSTD